MAGILRESDHSFGALQEAAGFLRTEPRTGDVALIKGRTTDHVTRLFMAQLGTIDCWQEHCKKTMLCDICWELGLSRAKLANAAPAHYRWE